MRYPLPALLLAAALAVAVSTTHARAQMLAGLPIDGIRCDTSEGALEHVHTHLQLYARGRQVVVPALVGMPQNAPCLYWLHTHATDGIIHTEAPVMRTFTLGQFFDIWDQPLTRTQADGVRAARGQRLRITVNGVAYRGDPREIPLRDREEIVIQTGPPFVRGRPADWSRY